MDIGCVVLESLVEKGVNEVDDRCVIRAGACIDDKLIYIHSGRVGIGVFRSHLRLDAGILIIDRVFKDMLLGDNGPYRHTDRLSDILNGVKVERVING